MPESNDEILERWLREEEDCLPCGDFTQQVMAALPPRRRSAYQQRRRLCKLGALLAGITLFLIADQGRLFTQWPAALMPATLAWLGPAVVVTTLSAALAIGVVWAMSDRV